MVARWRSDDGFAANLGHPIARRLDIGQHLGMGPVPDPILTEDGALRRSFHQDLPANLGPFVHAGVHPSPVLLVRSGSEP